MIWTYNHYNNTMVFLCIRENQVQWISDIMLASGGEVMLLCPSLLQIIPKLFPLSKVHYQINYPLHFSLISTFLHKKTLVKVASIYICIKFSTSPLNEETIIWEILFYFYNHNRNLRLCAKALVDLSISSPPSDCGNFQKSTKVKLIAYIPFCYGSS